MSEPVAPLAHAAALDAANPAVPPNLVLSPAIDRSETGELIRGSSLLLSGRFISLGLNLLVQVLTVRYLAKSDYGAFAYGIGVASMGASLVLLGLDKATARFVPIYQERGDTRNAFGTIVLAVLIVLGAGISLVLLVHGLQNVLGGTYVTDDTSMALLLILIALAPIEAFDSLLERVTAVFVGARAVFLRRHVMGPALKLAAVAVVIAFAADVEVLAWGYVAGGLLGSALYLGVLAQAWHRQGALQFLRPGGFSMPTRAVLAYCLPLMSSELVLVLRDSGLLVLLEYFHDTTAVAEYRAAVPLGRLNLVAMQSFSLLFIPLASRLFARTDGEGMNDLYWKTTIWIAVLSFPVFATTFSLARPMVVLFYGEKYLESVMVLLILSVGFFFHAALGFNAFTLRVYGKIRLIVAIDVASTIAGLVISIVLILRYGAIGAAMGMTTMLIIHNVLNQIGLGVGRTGIRLLDRRYLWIYALILLLSSAILLIEWFLNPPVGVAFGAVIAASLLLIRLTRRVVAVAEVFPSLLRFELLRRLLT